MRRPILLLLVLVGLCVFGVRAGAQQIAAPNPAAPAESNPTPPPGTIAAPSPPPQAAGSGQSTAGFLTQDLMTGDWGGERKKLADDGFTFTPTYVGEVLGNPSGGARQGVIYEGLLDLPLNFDLGKMDESLADTTIYADALEIHGPGLSQHFVGDFSGTSGITAYNTLRLDEVWIQKLFWDKKLSVKAGNVAVDTEFFQSSSASLFVNSSFGTFTLFANNLPGGGPAYPLAAPAVRVSFTPIPEFYVMAGVYGQDDRIDQAVNDQNGTLFALNERDGMLIMSEAGFLLNQEPNNPGLQGTYRLGSFVHTDDTPTWACGNGGTGYGVYGVMDQQLYSRDNRVISFFVRSGGAPSNTNFVDYYVEGGFNFTGFVPGRSNDVAGLAVARSHVSSDYSDAQVAAGNLPLTAETVIEATYKVQLAPWWSVQPDVQYIITPSGVEDSPNAVVLGLRTSVAF
jgi:porin